MIQDAIRRRNLLDWFVMVVCSTFATIGLYKDYRLAGQPLFYHALPVAWIAMFLICWIVIELLTGGKR